MVSCSFSIILPLCNIPFYSFVYLSIYLSLSIFLLILATSRVNGILVLPYISQDLNETFAPVITSSTHQIATQFRLLQTINQLLVAQYVCDRYIDTYIDTERFRIFDCYLLFWLPLLRSLFPMYILIYVGGCVGTLMAYCNFLANRRHSSPLGRGTDSHSLQM